MDETTAKALLTLALALDRDLAALFDVVATIPDEGLRRRFNRAVGDVMGVIARDLVYPIERLHPALRSKP